jgi:hypothetical protein
VLRRSDSHLLQPPSRQTYPCQNFAKSHFAVGATEQCSITRLCRRGVVVNVRLLGVIFLFALPAVVMAMRELIVIVGVGVPVHAVLDFAVIAHIVGHVPVIVFMGDGRVGVLGHSSFTLGVLLLGHMLSLLSHPDWW